jgi:signal transduction histidine kinase
MARRDTASVIPSESESTGAPRSHTVHLYDEDAVLVDEAARFLGATLGAGNAAIVAATPAHRDGVAARLHDFGLDLDRAIEQGRYVSVDAAEALTQVMTESEIDERRFADFFGNLVRQAAGTSPVSGRRVAIYGELVALLAANGEHEAAIKLERCWNRLSQDHHFSLRCGYPMAVFSRAEDGAALDRICAEHTTVVPLESYTALTNEDDKLRSIALLQQKAQLLQHEIAERARSDQALLERNLELRSAIEARDDFLYVAAHELRTPVTGLRGYAQLLLRDVRLDRVISPARLARSLGVIERQIYLLNQLIGRLLDTSQIHSGKLRVEPAPTDLATLVRQVLELQPPDDRHRIVCDGPDQLEAHVDPLRLEQVITNLIDNAIKFSPDGGEVTVAVADRGATGIVLSVTDSGLGIPMQLRESVFEKFHQAHPGSSLSGIGLGLFICREIVELHGGSIRIEDADDHGTRVVVTLPPTA